MSTKACPGCGSTEIETKQVAEFFHDNFCNSVESKSIEDECLVCGAEGDFESVNDQNIKNALEIIKKNGAKNIINGFSALGYNLAAMERALELPQRTLSKWRHDTAPTAAGLTLLKLISIFPWLIDVAETNFNYNRALEISAHASVSYIVEKNAEIQSGTTSGVNNSTYMLNVQINNVQNNNFHTGTPIEKPTFNSPVIIT